MGPMAGPWGPMGPSWGPMGAPWGPHGAPIIDFGHAYAYAYLCGAVRSNGSRLAVINRPPAQRAAGKPHKAMQGLPHNTMVPQETRQARGCHLEDSPEVASSSTSNIGCGRVCLGMGPGALGLELSGCAGPERTHKDLKTAPAGPWILFWALAPGNYFGSSTACWIVQSTVHNSSYRQ